MTSGSLLILGALIGLVAGLAGAIAPRRGRVPVTAALVAAAAVVESAAAIRVLATGHAALWHTSQLLPLTGVTLALSPLGAIFVVLVAVVTVPVALYWIGYAPHGMDTRPAASTFAIFITVLLLVPAAASVSTFMSLWELMALTSLALVLTDQSRREAARSAGVWYAVITHVGAAFILAAFLILAAHSGGQTFAALEVHARGLAPGARAAVFVLALVGFGSKAGVVPFHVWLPKAHPEAPSPVSALMSGAMVALGVYGIVLVGDVLLGGGPVWWWLIVLALGALSALFGSLHATNSTDLKRLLAYSTTDNIGLALLALGASGLFVATGHGRLGALSLVAALALLVNHAMFKGALFLSAGSVQVAAGTRDLDELGGLLRRMPQTGTMFLLAAASICALPPLNGFVGEWLLFQSLLHGLHLGSTAGDIAIPRRGRRPRAHGRADRRRLRQGGRRGLPGPPPVARGRRGPRGPGEHASRRGSARRDVRHVGRGANAGPAGRRARGPVRVAPSGFLAAGARAPARAGRRARRPGAHRAGRDPGRRRVRRLRPATGAGATADRAGH